ncbi:hypothetical protein DNTS_035034 [Danionella cerebrum]|uniref:Uncharacterized protein n=1 Tax=Danionella cerebrum TaxID=2873325 RepID=A0A553MRL9_9TELE|nr:hypothetical protein DNTS_035034 [Danionella translucida]
MHYVKDHRSAKVLYSKCHDPSSATEHARSAFVVREKADRGDGEKSSTFEEPHEEHLPVVESFAIFCNTDRFKNIYLPCLQVTIEDPTGVQGCHGDDFTNSLCKMSAAAFNIWHPMRVLA